MPPKEAKDRAKQIFTLSLDYHLSHAVFACNRTVEDIIKRHSQEKIDSLKKDLQKAEESDDNAKIIEIVSNIQSLSRPFRIYVEYVPGMDIEGGRVIRLPPSNQFIISLPEKLLQNSWNENGSYNADGIRALRQRMAHELGHIALHIEELLKDDTTQGSISLTGDVEDEADIFAAELLRLRHERNEMLYKAGVYK